MVKRTRQEKNLSLGIKKAEDLRRLSKLGRKFGLDKIGKHTYES